MSMKCRAFQHGLHVGPFGTVAPCCKWSGPRSELGTDFRSQWQTHEHRLAQGWIPECLDCEQDEQEGIDSHRIIMNRGDLGDQGLVDMKLSTVCNLVCKMCEVKSSSKWLSMVKHTPQFDWHESQADRHMDMTRLNTNDQHMDQIKSHCEQADYIKFTGGEPMMLEQVKLVLEHCVTTGHSGSQTVQITTNMTHRLDSDWLTLLDQFDRVHIQCSVDGIESRYEYVRQGAEWGVVWHNLTRLKQLADQRPHWQWSIQSLDQVLTMAQRLIIPDFYRDHGMTVAQPMCHSPTYYSYQSVPHDLRSRYGVQYHRPYDVAQWHLLVKHQQYHDAVWHTSFERECPELFDHKK